MTNLFLPEEKGEEVKQYLGSYYDMGYLGATPPSTNLFSDDFFKDLLEKASGEIFKSGDMDKWIEENDGKISHWLILGKDFEVDAVFKKYFAFC